MFGRLGAVVGLVDLHVWSCRCSSRFGGPTCIGTIMCLVCFVLLTKPNQQSGQDAIKTVGRIL